MKPYTVSFFNAVSLKKIGFPQESIFYYHNKTKEVSHVSDIPAFKNWLKLYTAAPVDCELDMYLPNGVALQLKSGLWIATFVDKEKIISRNHEYPLNAKTDLILKLFKEHLISF